MKALFVGSDPQLFDASSASYARIRSYADVIGSLTVLMRSGKPDSTYKDGPLTIIGVEGSKLAGLRKLRQVARKIINEQGIEIVSAQDPFEHGWVARGAVKGTSAKLHIQVHTDFLSPWFVRNGIARSPVVAMPAKNALRRRLADRVLTRADGIRTVSERVKKSLVEKYGEKIPEPTVLPIAPSAEFPNAVPLPEHPFKFVLITVGRLEPEKRIDDIIEALSRIHEAYPSVGLMIVGSGREEERLKKFAASQGLTGNVIFTNARNDAWGLMRSAQAYIQSSAYEGYGRTLVEAALVRLPIITTDVGIVGEVFKGYEDVLATPPGDPTNLAYLIVALLEDVSFRENMMRSAELKAQEHIQKYTDLPRLIAADLQATLQKPTSKP